MNKIFLTDKKTKTGFFCSPYPDDIISHYRNPDTYIWINIYQHHLDWIKKNLNIPNNILKLARDKSSIYPYYYDYKSWIFYRHIALNPNRFMTEGKYSWLNFIISGRIVITSHEYPIDIFNDIDESADKLARYFCAGTPSFVSHIIELLTKDYIKFHSRLNTEAEFIAHNLLSNKTRDNSFKIHNISNELSFCLRSIKHQKDAFNDLKKHYEIQYKEKSSSLLKEISLKLNETIYLYINLNGYLESIKWQYQNNIAEIHTTCNRKHMSMLKIGIACMIIINIVLAVIIFKIT